jgi:uncharacterized protein
VRVAALLGVLVLGALLVVALMYALQRRLIYLPTGEVPPAAAVLPDAEEVTFATADGLELAGWWVPPRGEPTGATVVVHNGNGGNRALRAPLADELAAEGVAVLLYDYRGYGGNPGSPTEEGLATDARAAHAYVTGRDDVDPQRLVLFGESLGAAVALEVALAHPPAVLVLRSPFTSLPDVAAEHYPFLPVQRLLHDRYPSIDRVTRLTVPVLVLAGDDDGIVPFGQSREVFEAAPEPKRLVRIEGADHNDPRLGHGPRVVGETIAWIEAHTR